MSGIKQFYMKNIKLFTVLLIIIAAFLGYKAYQKWNKSPPRLTGPAENFIGTGVGSMLALKAQQGEGVSSNIGGYLSRSNFGERGLTSKDLALADIDTDVMERGESGYYQKGGSKELDISKFSAYGATKAGDF